MKKRLFIALATLSLSATSFAFAEPANLGLLEQKVIRYHNSGDYARDIATKDKQALHYLKQRVAENIRHGKPDQLAIVLDIDETSLSNYPDMRKLNFGGTNQQINALEEAVHDKAINPTLKLFRYARAHDVAVFFVTGRREKDRASTITNLNRAGYHDFTKLIMKPNNYHQPSVVNFKENARKKIIDSGYDIVLNIGDQWSDLKGQFTDREIKLPDPYYYIP